MRHDPARIADTKAWLVRASRDLRAAGHDLSASPPLFDAVVFHCQQAAEKSLKAFLTWHDHAFRRTDSLEELREECLQIEASLRTVIDRSVPLTRYAWLYRYPGDAEQRNVRSIRHMKSTMRSSTACCRSSGSQFPTLALPPNHADTVLVIDLRPIALGDPRDAFDDPPPGFRLRK